MARIFKNPGEHARCCGLAVGPRDGQNMSAMQNVFSEPLWARRVTLSTIQHCFDDLDSTAHDIADNDAVRIEIELCRIDTLMDINAKLFELRTHGRIDIAIAARHFVARRARQGRNTAHECSTNSEYVYVHGFLVSFERIHDLIHI